MSGFYTLPRRVLLLLTACSASPFVEVRDFGTNPGGLRMFEHVPDDVGEAPPLVLFLHGCSQDHDAARATGFVERSDAEGFVLLAAEQALLNNASRCFNWFAAGDTTRDAGEALSLREMVADATERHDVDPARIFVAGLSAGAAMTVALLAVYPEVFAAGGAAAGGPYGCATDVTDAAACMAGEHSEDWVAKVRDASDHEGPWPRLVALQGDADRLVDPSNLDLLADQWAGVHALTEPVSSTFPTSRGDAQVTTFGDRVVETVRFPDVDHVLPICPDAACGETAPFLVDVGFCASAHITKFFGLP